MQQKEKPKYSKPPLTYTEQLSLLEDRGLLVKDREKAIHLLESLSYYRFSAYWYPLLKEPKREHLFKDGAKLETAFNLYCFDRELRQLIFGELEKIEISFRAKLTYVYSHSEKTSFWYENEELFFNPNKYQETITKIKNEFDKSKSDFVKAYKTNYSNSEAPSWMILETCSFGSLSFLYSNLKGGDAKRKVAQYYGLSDTVLASWLHSLSSVRNTCAHHSRLWNVKLAVSPIIPKKTKYPWIDKRTPNNRVYFLLSMIRYFLFTINPKSTFTEKIKQLLNRYPIVDYRALGMEDKNVFNHKFWNNLSYETTI